MVDLEIEDGLAVITIDRPHARNAISLETMDQLDEALDGADGARALVIKGAGDKAFVSGGDLKELAALGPRRTRRRWPGGCEPSATASRRFPARCWPH